MTSQLGVALRALRDRVRPDEVGLPSGGDLRAPGLRREELAVLAGVSVDYLVRLEQGRATNPSPEVLAALSRALRLSVAERDVLYRQAGSAPPGPRTVSRHISPGLQRILDRLVDTPVAVYSASWELVTHNPLWAALLGEVAPASGRDRNLVWQMFMQGDSRIVRESGDRERFARTVVNDLHDAAARYPDDADLAAMIADLRRGSEWFAGLWDAWVVEQHVSERKTVVTPTVGELTLDCDVLASVDSDLRVVVYTATPGSEDAAKLDLLRVTGTQQLV